MKNSRIVGLVTRKMNHENSRGPRCTSRSKARRSAAASGRPSSTASTTLGAVEGALHRQVHARREHRVDERVGVADHAGSARRCSARSRTSSCRSRRRGRRRARAPASRSASAGHSAIVSRKNSGSGFVARLQVVRPADRADARRAVGERDEPEPAVLEPEDRDVAFELAGQPLGAGEVAVQRRAVVALVLLLAAQLVREQRVAPGRVDDEARAPAAPRAVLELDLRTVAPSASKATSRTRWPSKVRAPFAGGVAKEHLVELGAAHLPGVRHRLVPGLAELDELAMLVLGRDELDAVLLHADRLDLRRARRAGRTGRRWPAAATRRCESAGGAPSRRRRRRGRARRAARRWSSRPARRRRRGRRNGKPRSATAGSARGTWDAARGRILQSTLGRRAVPRRRSRHDQLDSSRHSERSACGVEFAIHPVGIRRVRPLDRDGVDRRQLVGMEGADRQLELRRTVACRDLEQDRGTRRRVGPRLPRRRSCRSPRSGRRRPGAARRARARSDSPRRGCRRW